MGRSVSGRPERSPVGTRRSWSLNTLGRVTLDLSAGGGERLKVSRSLAIPLSELEWRATTSGGPGGQHANRSATRVEVRFDVSGSPSLGPRQRARLLERLGPVVRAAAGDERSQVRNRQLALERLAAKLAAGLAVEPPRHPTKPSRAERERRLTDKHHRARRKRDRQPLRDPDG
jgi:ribosome-associated protein